MREKRRRPNRSSYVLFCGSREVLVRIRSISLLFFVTFALLLLWMAPFTHAALPYPTWHPVSVPIGAAIHAISFHPTNSHIAYAGGVTGFYRSTDGGRTWKADGSGLPVDAQVRCLATSASTPASLFVSTEEHGIFRSSDEGRSWTHLASVSHACLTVSPHYDVDNTAFAWWRYWNARNRRWEAGTVKLMGHQTITLPITTGRLVLTPIYDDTGPNIDLLALWGIGYRVSKDGGMTWSDPQMVTDTTGIQLTSLAVSPSFGEDHTLFVGSGPIIPYQDEGPPGIFKSTDGGRTWRLISHSLPEKHTTMGIILAPDYHNQHPGQRSLYVLLRGPAPSSPTRVFRSSDGGETWGEVQIEDGGRPLEAIYSLAFPPDYKSNPVRLASTEWGVYRSTDRGHTWHPASQGIIGGYVSALAHSGETLYMRVWEPLAWSETIPDRIYRSEDGGHTWLRAAARGLPPAYVTQGSTRDLVPHDLAALPDGSLFAWGMESQGVYRSVDQGETWTPALQGLTTTTGMRVFTSTIYFLDFTPREPYTLYAAGGSTVYRSTDLGEHWHLLDLPVTGMVDGLVATPWPTSDVYVFFREGYLLRSRDGGTTWDDLSSRLISSNMPWTYLDSRVLAVHPSRPGVVYVGGGFAVPPPYTNHNRLYVSEDGGEHWRDLSDHVPSDRTIIRGLYISVHQPDRLWLLMEDTRYRANPAARRAHRLFISDDGGLTWVELGLDPRLHQAGIRELLQFSPDRLYAASGGYGLWTWDFMWKQPTFLPVIHAD